VSKTRYAFNVTRQAFINLGVAVADTLPSRLRGLLGKMRLRADESLWVIPSRGIHTFGLMFSIDVIYLDANQRVVRLVEDLSPLRVAPICFEADSVLQLPARSIYGSGTQLGDQLLICTAEEMEAYWTDQGHKSFPEALRKTV
jgi:uncharacterized protein